MSTLGFRYDRGGLHFPEIRLWMDGQRAVGPEARVFVSHAHSDHIGAHASVIFSVPTQKLMRARVPGMRNENVLEWRKSFPLSAFQPHPADPAVQFTLLPAGHILGSAMAFLEGDEGSLLYTGDFKLRHGLSAERCQPCRADTLIMETTFGRPEYVFPSLESVIEGVTRFCREGLAKGETPVLLGYSLGKAQEILCALANVGMPISLSPRMMRLTQIYELFGQKFPPYTEWDGDPIPDGILIAPPGPTTHSLRARLGKSRLAVLSGWAMRPSYVYQCRADAAFPLSDHADFPDLVEFVKMVNPSKVYTLHGFTVDFADHLRDLGFDAEPLGQSDQLEFYLPKSRSRSPRRVTASSADALC